MLWNEKWIITEGGKREFGNRISAETISRTADCVLPEIQNWGNRVLDRVYPIVRLDAVHYKVMDEKNRSVTRVIYNVLTLTTEGRIELLGMYISKCELANFWLNVLVDLQNRGIQDMLIACEDGLKGSLMPLQAFYLRHPCNSASCIRYATLSSM